MTSPIQELKNLVRDLEVTLEQKFSITVSAPLMAYQDWIGHVVTVREDTYGGMLWFRYNGTELIDTRTQFPDGATFDNVKMLDCSKREDDP